MPANLQLTNVFLVDAQDNATPAPIVGVKFFIRAEWTTTGLSPSDSYTVRFSLDGIVLDSTVIQGRSGTGLEEHASVGGWYSSWGSHFFQATLDGGDAIHETSEEDNHRGSFYYPSAPTLPAKLLWPLGSSHDPEVAFTGYNDVDPRPGRFQDYAGGDTTYDGHDAFDLAIPNFAGMDAGRMVYAAAAGTVIGVVGSYFDRETVHGDRSANYVSIDMGSGWVATYYHFKQGSVAVSLGSAVVAGQPLGLMGSSGNSNGVHLHFSISYRGQPVETMYDPSAYFVDPPAYRATILPHVNLAGITNGPLTAADMSEQPQNYTKFPVDQNWIPWFWYQIPNIPVGSIVTIQWFKPDGALYATDGYTEVESPGGGYYHWYVNGTSDSPGTWEIALSIDDVELARRSFTVTPAGGGEPEILVESGGARVIDGRSTPIDLGARAVGSSSASTTFTVKNTGASDLTLGDLVLPPDVTLVGAFSTTIPAGGSATFALALDTTRPGSKFGSVRFTTNDADEGAFDFNVGGLVVGSQPAGTTAFSAAGPPLVYLPGSSPQVLDTNLFLDGASRGAMALGQLMVEFASNGRDEDRLGIRDGDPWEQGGIRVYTTSGGGYVTFGAYTVAEFTGGMGTTPLLVKFTDHADFLSVRALLRNITYADTADAAVTSPRYIRFSATDGAGFVAADLVKCVIFDGRTVSSMAVDPLSATMNIFEQRSFHATARMSDGTTRDLTNQVNWQSSNEWVATISSAGIASPGSHGTVYVVGRFTTFAVFAPLTVAHEVSISIAPETSTLAKGLSRQFRTTLHFSDDSTKDVTSQVDWWSSAPEIVSFGLFGKAKGLAEGSSTITATYYNTFTASTTVAVTPAVLTSIAVGPAGGSVAKGLTRSFTATGTYTDDSTRDLTGVAVWTSGAPAVATIDASGLARGLAIGFTPITAELASVRATTTLEVGAPVLARIDVGPVEPGLIVGGTRRLSATGVYTDGSTADLTRSVVWTSSADGVLTISPDGLATALAAGAATIEAVSGDVRGGIVLTAGAPPPPPPPPPPTAIAAAQIDAKAGFARSIRVVFGSPVVSPRAALAAFRWITAGNDRIFGTKDDKSLPLTSAVLASDGLSIVVTPRTKVSLKQPLRLTMVTDGGPVVARSDGRAIDGDGDGRPGGTYLFALGTKPKLPKPPKPPKTKAVVARAHPTGRRVTTKT